MSLRRSQLTDNTRHGLPGSPEEVKPLLKLFAFMQAHAAAAAALWFAIAWRSAWVLLLVPMIGGGFVFLVRRNRRLDPLGHAEDDDFF